jgi:hypothetical protein
MTEDTDYHRLPGLYRVWDLPTLLADAGDYRIHFAEPTQDGTPLYAVYARPATKSTSIGRPQ